MSYMCRISLFMLWNKLEEDISIVCTRKNEIALCGASVLLTCETSEALETYVSGEVDGGKHTPTFIPSQPPYLER